MNKFEYIKCFWNDTDDETPVLLFYEVDPENERYARRMTEVFPDRSVRRAILEEGFDFVTEAPVPTVDEINKGSEFYAIIISREEFDSVYDAEKYSGEITFPK